MSEVKVNKISPRTACGTTTLGDSGDTFTIPAGVSITNSGTASGFGATGAASWNTTVKTGDFTAVSGEGYFVNTTSGEITVTLPASPSAGAVVAIKDYANTFDTNKCIINRNGSKIGGGSNNAELQTEGIAVTLVFIDSTQGWLVTDSGLQSEAPLPTFIAATGGNTIVTCGSFKTHIFTGPGTFTVCSVGNPAGSSTVEYLVVAGGGGAGTIRGGGGGAGGFRARSTAPGCNSPLIAPANIPVTATGFPITVGAGGAGNGPVGPGPSTQASAGTNSIFSTITSTGGGFGGNNTPCSQDNGGPGGSGGGGGGQFGATGGSGNAPPVSPAQGTNGGNDGRPGTPGSGEGGAGGGGAACAGSVSAHEIAGPGGLGSYIANSFIGPTAPSYGTAYSPGGFKSIAWWRFWCWWRLEWSRTTSTAKRGSDCCFLYRNRNTGGGAGGRVTNNADNAGGAGGSGVDIRYKFHQ